MNSNELHVIFGTGALGSAVMRELLNRGKRVRMVNRSGTTEVPAGVELVKGDATDVKSTTAATVGASADTRRPYPAYAAPLIRPDGGGRRGHGGSQGGDGS